MKLRTLFVPIWLVASMIPARAAEPDTALPAMNFVSSLARDELYGLIKANAAFSHLDKELVGSPIVLRVSHSLLPGVTNNSVVVTYEIRVQGKDTASYAYQRSFTRAINFRAKDDATYGLGRDGLDWLKSTATEFAAAASQDARLGDLKREYDRYFGTPTP